MIRIEFNRDPRGGDVRVITNNHWFRLAAYYGLAPGSHKGLWRTNTGAQGVHGWNYRIGPLERCLTLLAHRRKLA